MGRARRKAFLAEVETAVAETEAALAASRDNLERIMRESAQTESDIQAAAERRRAETQAEVRHRRREQRGAVLVATTRGAIGTPKRLDDLKERAKRLAEGAQAPATRRAYLSDWRAFETWCNGLGLEALPAAPTTIGLYFAEHAEGSADAGQLSMATLTRRLSAISTVHRLAEHHLDTRHPAIRMVLQGARRERGTAQRQAAPLTTERLRLVIGTCDAKLIDLRDKALLLLGFAGAMRQSEIVALDVDDITVETRGLRVVIRKSKADQEGEGQVVPISRTNSPTCPVAAYTAWLDASGIETGAVFRRIDRHGNLLPNRLQPEAVADMIRGRASRAGLPDPERYSGHSLRAGLATSAAAAGVEERIIQGQTRHRSVTTLRKYIREGELFVRNLAAEVGL